MTRIATALFAATLALAFWAVPASASDTNAENAEIMVAEGNKAYTAGDNNAALTWFEEAASLDPQNVEARYFTGMLLYNKAQYPKAIEHLAAAVKLNPMDVPTRLLLGIALFRVEMFKESYEQLKIVDDLKPNTQARFYMGLALIRRGDYDNGRAQLQKAAAMNPELKNGADYASAVALLNAGHKGDATSLLNRVASADPASPLAIAAAEAISRISAQPKPEHPVQIDAAFGVLYDSNVVLQSTSGAVPLPSDVSGQGDMRIQFSGQLRYMPIKHKGFSAGVLYRIYEGWNMSLHLYDFHQQEAGVATSFCHKRLCFDLPYRFTYSFYNNNYSGYSFAHSLSPSMTIQQTSSATRLGYNYRYEDFFNTPLSPRTRTGNNHQAYLTEYYKPLRRLLFSFGYLYEYNDANGAAWTYQAHHGALGMRAEAIDWLRIDLGLEYVYRGFSNVSSDPRSAYSPSTQGLHPRIDNQFNATVDFVFPLYADLLYLDVNYTFQLERSNIPGSLLDYNRNLVGALLQVVY